MDAKTAKNLYKASNDVQMLALEDLYVTGILARKINIKPVGNNQFWLGIRKSMYETRIKRNGKGRYPKYGVGVPRNVRQTVFSRSLLNI